MSVIYRPRPFPYIPNALNAAQITTAESENDLPAIFKRRPVPQRRWNPLPYVSREISAAVIQTSSDENDFPAIFHRSFAPVIRRRSDPYTRSFGPFEEATDNDDELVVYGNKWKFFRPQIRTRPHVDFPYPGGEDPLPPIIVGNKAARHTQGRGPKTKLFTMRLGLRHGPSTR